MKKERKLNKFANYWIQKKNNSMISIQKKMMKIKNKNLKITLLVILLVLRFKENTSTLQNNKILLMKILFKKKTNITMIKLVTLN